jgi:hypothetical protein
MPDPVQPLVASARLIGVFSAILLNPLLRIGVHKRAKLVYRLGESDARCPFR